MTGVRLAAVVGADAGRRFSLVDQITRGLSGGGRALRRGDVLALGQAGSAWAGVQPAPALPVYVSGREGSLLVFAGRLDNRAELAASLECRDTDDGQLALAAWLRWGDAAFARFVGPFVALAWDPPAEELVLAADPIGHETLFVLAGDGFLAVAGNPQALRGCPGVPDGTDIETLCAWVAENRYPPDRTMFAGIGRVAPGHVLRAGRGTVAQRPFWRPADVRPVRYRRDQDYVDAARELLDRVVAPHVPTAGAIVADLSGGLDSAAVVATAARLAPDCRIDAFTLVSEPGAPQMAVPGPFAVDDWPNASAVAAAYPNVAARRVEAGGLAPDEVDPTPEFMAFGCPSGESSHAGWMAAKWDAMRPLAGRVLLTGDGGNLSLTLAGFGRLADLLLGGRWVALAGEVRALALRTGWPLRRIVVALVLLPTMPRGARRLVRRLRRREGPAWADHVPLRPEAARRYGVEDRLAMAGKQRPAELRGGHRAQTLDQLDRFISKGFRRSWSYRARGFDARAPLLDLRLVSFVLGLPADQFLRHGVTRYLARRVLEDRLPHAVAWDPRQYLHCPEWLHRLTRSKPYWLPELDRLERSAAVQAVLDLPRIRRLAEAWPEAPDPAHEGACREVVARGIVAGQFLRWMERENQ